VPGVTDRGLKPRQIKKVAILGGGLMGSGIATVLFLSGYEVVLKEVNQKFRVGGLGRVKGMNFWSSHTSWSHGSSVHRYGLYAIQWIVEVNGKPTPNLEAFVNVTNVRLLNVLCSVVFIFNIETLIFLSWGTQEIEDGEFVRVKTVHFNGKPKEACIILPAVRLKKVSKEALTLELSLIEERVLISVLWMAIKTRYPMGPDHNPKLTGEIPEIAGSNIHDVNSGVKPLKSILKKPKVTNVANGSGADVSTTKVSRKVSVDERLDVHVYSVQNIPAGEAQDVGSQNVKIHQEGPNIYLTAGMNVENATAFAACNEGQHSCVVAGDETTGNIGKPDLMSSKASDGSNVDANGNIDKGSDAGNNATKKPMSFANAINSEQVSKKLNFRTLVNEERVVDSDTVLPKSTIDNVKNMFENSLVGFFVGKSLAFPIVQNYVKNTWGIFGLQKLMRNDDGVFLFKFATKNGLEQVLERGPWMIHNSPIILNKWTPYVSLIRDEITKVPVWIKLRKIPLVAYSEDGLSLIATQIGKPIMLDAFTSSMCCESWGRIGYARALVEINADMQLKKEAIMVSVSSDPSKVAIKPRNMEDMDTSDKTNDGFKEVRRKKNKGKKADQQPRSSHIDGIRLNEPKPNFYWQKTGTNKSGADLVTKGQMDGPSTSNSFDLLNSVDVGDGCGVSSSMGNQAVGHDTGTHTSSTWNEEFESDDEVDEVIFSEGNKFDDQFDIRLKGRVRK
ncbi:hypothetical protein Tco_0407607, partial [Tanacetum coccineum]